MDRSSEHAPAGRLMVRMGRADSLERSLQSATPPPVNPAAEEAARTTRTSLLGKLARFFRAYLRSLFTNEPWIEQQLARERRFYQGRLAELMLELGAVQEQLREARAQAYRAEGDLSALRVQEEERKQLHEETASLMARKSLDNDELRFKVLAQEKEIKDLRKGVLWALKN